MKHIRTQVSLARHGKTPFARSALACALLAATATGAKAEATAEELQRIKLYGLVSIADDKLDSWGPWSTFEAPAAGESVATASPRVNPGDAYRPLPQTTTPTTSFGLGCVGGSICGFGAIESYSYSESLNNSGLKTVSALSPVSEQVRRVAAVQFNGSVVEAGEFSPLLPQAISLQGTVLGQGGPLVFADSGVLNLEIYEGEGSGLSYYRQSYGADERSSQYVDLSADRYYQQHDVVGTQVANANFYSQIKSYIAGLGGQAGSYNRAGDYGRVVIGYTTSEADLSVLRASGFSAQYAGVNSEGASVNLNVRFGDGTWDGAWNGGVDRLAMPSNGRLNGIVGVTAEGTLNGVNFVSTKVGTNDVGATVTGFVRGAFFGPQAAAAAGVMDIIKSNPNPAPVNTISASVVVEGYANARQVSTFVTTRVDQSEK